jgi:hypothetical protein
MLRLGYVFPGLVISLGGCASTQINYNTLDIASTFDSLITKQVVFNLKKTQLDPFSIPAFVKVASQTASTTNSVSPTFTFPLSPTTTAVTQLASAATTTLTGSKTLATAGRGLSLAASDQWSQTYSLSAVIDPDQLRRLRSLFRFATGQLNQSEFEATYPLIETSGAGAAPEATVTTVSLEVEGKPITVATGVTPPPVPKERTVYLRRTFATDAQGNVLGYTYVIARPDLTFIKPPGCIMCDYGATLRKEDLPYITDPKILAAWRDPLTSLRILQMNTNLHQDFLYNGNLPDEEAVLAPANGLDALAVRASQLKYFYEFVLFVEEASSQGTGSPASGGQSEGRKTPNLERISVPVAAGTVTPP